MKTDQSKLKRESKNMIGDYDELSHMSSPQLAPAFLTAT
jgi:hypothetical protein